MNTAILLSGFDLSHRDNPYLLGRVSKEMRLGDCGGDTAVAADPLNPLALLPCVAIRPFGSLGSSFCFLTLSLRR